MDDLSNLAALIAADVYSRGAGRPDPGDVLNVPVMNRTRLDSEIDQVWAVVRIDLGGGQLTEIEVRKCVPASTELEARYGRQESGIQELRLVGADGALHGLTVVVPLPDSDEDDDEPVSDEPEEWDDRG